MIVFLLLIFPVFALVAIYFRPNKSLFKMLDLNHSGHVLGKLFTLTKSHSMPSVANGSDNNVSDNNGGSMVVDCAQQQQQSNDTNNNNQDNQNNKKKQKRTNKSKLKQTKVSSLPDDGTFSFYRSESVAEGEPRHLLVLFAWLFAQERHLDKYRQLYMDRGFDVLTITVKVWDFLVPQSGSQKIADLIVAFLGERAPQYRGFLFHAFSVGAYQMGEVFVSLGKEVHKQQLQSTTQLLRGIVYDSALDVDEAAIGLSKATTNNAFFQWAINNMMNAHLWLCYHISTRHYRVSSQAIHDNRFGCPTLVFLSKDDEVANYQHQFKVIDKWREQGIEVLTQCWEQSPHVSHFFKHPEEYRNLLDNFLQTSAQIL